MAVRMPGWSRQDACPAVRMAVRMHVCRQDGRQDAGPTVMTAILTALFLFSLEIPINCYKIRVFIIIWPTYDTKLLENLHNCTEPVECPMAIRQDGRQDAMVKRAVMTAVRMS
jgi:hypothetical protein